ncbi:imidazole glycerol phosphate synthase subunit HisF [Halobacteriovorax sp. HLS]|uniref:imidazole glycerol phosphate synthase subunit HisF n=1 Tax=Halobacteriovorax sp. HLS TaxID=2234000 RepID=UPI000FDA0384|nr:imidazole glycerol phosphate synthase cyclase subunit [Halobacteriovorax sp. HLS]
MRKIRIISRLDIKGPNLVKGIHLEGLRVLGDPQSFCEYYYNNEADEIFYMDCVASLFERNSLDEIITKTSQKTFIPITVGGGLRTIEDIRNVLQQGADKVCINTAAIKNPQFIRQASQLFGSSTIVVAIEAIKQENGAYFAFIDNGREETGKDIVAWAKEVESLGAGEIVITSVDREGTGEGFDIDLIKSVTDVVSIPVVAHGGGSSLEDTIQMIKETNVSAVAIASAFHYDTINNAKFINNVSTSEGNKNFINSGKRFSKINTFSILELKDALIKADIQCRRG